MGWPWNLIGTKCLSFIICCVNYQFILTVCVTMIFLAWIWLISEKTPTSCFTKSKKLAYVSTIFFGWKFHLEQFYIFQDFYTCLCYVSHSIEISKNINRERLQEIFLFFNWKFDFFYFTVLFYVENLHQK